MKDVIRLCGLSFYGFHGVSEAERETGRAYEVDCELETYLTQASQTDRVSDTVDYSAVYTEIKRVVEGAPSALVETVANQLAVILLDKFPIYRVTLKIRKMQPPIPGQVRYVEIEVTRYQWDIKKVADSSPQPPT